MRVLLYLQARSFVNLLRLTLTSPKRLIPVALTGLWIIFYFGMMIMSSSVGHHSRGGVFTLSNGILYSYWNYGFALISIGSCYLITRAFRDSMLVFSLSEIDIVCPTPVPSRDVLALKLIQTYFRYLGFVFLMAVVLMMGMLVLDPAHFVSLLVRTALGLMAYGIILINICTSVNLTFSAKPEAKQRSEWWTKAFLYALLAFTAGSILSVYARLHSPQTALIEGIRNPAMMTVFFPLRWTLDMVLGIGATGVQATIHQLVLCLLALGTFIMATGRDGNAYEPSLEISARTASIQAALRSGKSVMSLTLGRKNRLLSRGTAIKPFGRGAAAIAWKNVNVFVRLYLKLILIILAVVEVLLLVARVVAPDAVGGSEVGYFLCTIFGYGILMTVSTMSARFGQELSQANLLKPMPIPAWKVVAIQPIVESLIYALLSWVVTAMVAVTYVVPTGTAITAYSIALPFLVCSVLSLQTIVTILYPNKGDFSHRTLSGLFSLGALFIGLLPPAIVSGLLMYLKAPLLLVILVTIVISSGISVAGIFAASKLYERFDPTND